MTDLFITIVRKNYERDQEKKPSVRENLKQNSGQKEQVEKPKKHKSPER